MRIKRSSSKHRRKDACETFEPTRHVPVKVDARTPSMPQRPRTLPLSTSVGHAALLYSANAERPDFADPSPLRGLSATDGFTVVTRPVDPQPTRLLPAAIQAPANVAVSVRTLSHTLQTRRIMTGLPDAPDVAEDSFANLRAYSGPVTHRAALNAPWFQPASGDSAFDVSLRAFFDRWGTLPKPHPGLRRPGALDTEVFTSVAVGQFSAEGSRVR